jgi:hypothetical protein
VLALQKQLVDSIVALALPALLAGVVLSLYCPGTDAGGSHVLSHLANTDELYRGVRGAVVFLMR